MDQRSGTYYGDAVIVSIASATEECTIGSTMGLSGAAIAGLSNTLLLSVLSLEVLDEHYSETKTNFDGFVYGVWWMMAFEYR